MKGEVKRIYQNFLDALRTPELRILPGQLAFYILMSMIPIIANITMMATTIIEKYFIFFLLFIFKLYIL